MSLSQDDINALLEDAAFDDGDGSATATIASFGTDDAGGGSNAGGGTATANRTAETQGTAVSPEVDRILKLEVPIVVTLADREMSIRAIVDLKVGSILEFDTRADAELTLLVNNRRVGRGHAVKVGEQFGLRVTTVGSVSSRIHAMKR